MIKGDVLLHDRRIPQAIDELQAAEKLHDSWVVHTLLGQAYQAAEQYPEAQKEWELCVKRRGEAADAFIADTSSMRYLPAAYYWLGRAQERLGARPPQRTATASTSRSGRMRKATRSSPTRASDCCDEDAEKTAERTR